jgi:CheY-like chemotaxis protein
LSLCYGIIKEHGGAIHAKSEFGHGASFTIELPIATPAQIAEACGSPTDVAGAAASHAGKRILIIDDEEWILTMTRTVLEEEGYSVDIAHDGEEARSALTKSHYDLLVCDQKMPGLSGSQLYRQLLTDDPKSAERFMFMTGDVVNENFQQFLKETRTACLTKPFSLTQLRTAVAGALAED